MNAAKAETGPQDDETGAHAPLIPAEDFDNLQRLVLEEWPQVPQDELARTNGDLDLLTEVVAEHTEHTRALIRLQLAELILVYERLKELEAAGVGGLEDEGTPLAEEPEPRPVADRQRQRRKQRKRARQAPEATAEGQAAGTEVEALLGQVEAYLWELARSIPHDMASAGARTARRHMGVSVSIAAALGFLFGMFVIGGGGRKNERD